MVGGEGDLHTGNLADGDTFTVSRDPFVDYYDQGASWQLTGNDLTDDEALPFDQPLTFHIQDSLSGASADETIVTGPQGLQTLSASTHSNTSIDLSWSGPGDGTLSLVGLFVPTVTTGAATGSFAVTNGTTFQISGTGSFAGLFGANGTANGLVSFSNTVGANGRRPRARSRRSATSSASSAVSSLRRQQTTALARTTPCRRSVSRTRYVNAWGTPAAAISVSDATNRSQVNITDASASFSMNARRSLG